MFCAHSCSVLCFFSTWTLGICYGFVLLSSAAGYSDVRLFGQGENLIYKLHSNVLLNDKENGPKNVGFSISADLSVDVVWNKQKEKILKLELINPKLFTKSRKAPTPDGFVPHTSKLKEFQNHPFYIIWVEGKIEKIILVETEPTSLLNLKKGISSLYQFQLLDGNVEEYDASGLCTVKYSSTSLEQILKTKTNCRNIDLEYVKTPESILGYLVNSTREVRYEIDPSGEFIRSIKSREKHVMYLSAHESLGNSIESEQTLTFVERNINKNPSVQAENALEALRLFQNKNLVYVSDTLKTTKEASLVSQEVKFASTVTEMRDQLDASLLGTLSPTKAFLKLVSVGRTATKEDIVKAIEAKKNKRYLHQLYDVLGYVQTVASHEAAMSKLKTNDTSHLDFAERYLWALSLAPHPNPQIISKLQKLYQQESITSQKLQETLVLTLASMTYRMSRGQDAEKNKQITSDIEQMIISGLETSTNEESYQYLRALKNLKSPTTIPVLLKKIKNGSLKEGVLAWKALKSMNALSWNKDVLNAARKSFFQIDKKYDSSSRTLAADVLIESQLNEEKNQILKDLIYFLSSNETNYEIKQYVLQRVNMIAEENREFREKIEKIIKSDKKINNYSTLSPRGLSTAIKRNFAKGKSSTGSLLSIQEIQNTVVKRGIVDVILEKSNEVKDLFTIGIFTGGLSSFLSSDTDDQDEDETVTAGMELNVLGTQLRPFVFFTGQGELMSHVWSGTASDKTTAFQSLILLQDDKEHIRLGSGFIIELDLKGAVSFDLSGQVEISLWNRNAKSLVEKDSGLYTTGVIKLDTEFVKSQVEFSASIEPKLNSQSDIDFAGNPKFCMRLSQVDTVFKHNIFKIERIPGSKHKLRIAKYQKSLIPGMTYSLNRKNNEMCNTIFQ